jgi:uncharacterized protein (TIGR03435 family)
MKEVYHAVADCLAGAKANPVASEEPAAESARALPPGSDTSGASLVTEIQEQLGLRLESAKVPLPVLVIDSAEKPSEN